MIKKFNLQLAELGKIKIGKKGAIRKTQDGSGTYRLPEKTDHFTITTLNRDANGDFIPDERFLGIYGKEPKELNIFFLFDSIDMNFQTEYAYYAGSKCLCRGDGEKANRILKTGAIEDVVCDPDTCEFHKSEKCKVGGVLNCLLAESQSVGGIYKLRTHSFHSVRNILASLTQIQIMTNGILSGIPLQLTLTPRQVSLPDKGSTVVYVLNIEYRGLRKTLLDTVREIKKERIEFNLDMKRLEMSEIKIESASPEEIQEIAEEFYPENQDNYPKAKVTESEVTVAGQPVTVINKSRNNAAEQKPAEIINNETGEVTETKPEPVKTAEPVPEEKPVTAPATATKPVDEEKRKRMLSLKSDIERLFKVNNVGVQEQREHCFEVLGVAEVSNSRSEEKLSALKVYLEDTFNSAAANGKEEL